MANLRILSILFGALAVLWLGVVGAPASAGSPVPSCHEAAMAHGMTHEVPASTPDKPVKAMGCCVACVTASLLQPPVRSALRAPAPAHDVRLHALPTGRTTAPEPGPPRTVAA